MASKKARGPEDQPTRESVERLFAELFQARKQKLINAASARAAEVLKRHGKPDGKGD